MDKIQRRIKTIVSSSRTMTDAVSQLAKDAGIDIPPPECDIVEKFPPADTGTISIESFRMAIVTAVVRTCYPEYNDYNIIGVLSAMYARFTEPELLLTLAEMELYHNLMHLLSLKK